MAENEKQTTSAKVNSIIEAKKKVFIAVLSIALVCILAFVICAIVMNNAKASNLTRLDEISYTLTEDSAALEESELEARRIDALDKLEGLNAKGGIVGARANMLTAEIYYQQKKYSDSANAWQAVAKKSSKSYLAPIAYYNLGVCYEQLGQNEDAIASYKKASENEDFVLRTHAAFSYGRTLEQAGNIQEAYNAYSDLNDKNPDDSWAKLAKTRMIALKAEGKIE